MRRSRIHTIPCKKVKGTLLFYAVGFMAIMGVLCLTLIQIGHRSAMIRAKVETIYLTHLNLESAWLLGLNSEDPSTLGNHIELTPGAKIESVSRNWGLYPLLSITSSVSGYSVTRSAILGYPWLQQNPVLVVPGDYEEVGFGGAATVKGNVQIPNGKWKKIPTGAETGKLNFAVSRSKPGDPFSELRAEVKELTLVVNTDHTLHLNELGDSLSHSFSDSTLYILCEPKQRLKDIALSGNLFLLGSELFIDASCQLQDVWIQCARVTVGEGFTGTIHVACTEEVIVEKSALLEFPSSLLLNVATEGSYNSIQLNEDSEVHGAIALLHQHHGKREGSITISPNARVIGEIFCDGTSQIHGHISGTVHTSRLKAGSKGRSYAQAMTEGTLDNEVPNPFGISAENGKQKNILKWLD